MWTWLASLIGGPVVTGLINAYKAKLDAANTQDRIAADLAAKEIEAEIEAHKQASAIMMDRHKNLACLLNAARNPARHDERCCCYVNK